MNSNVLNLYENYKRILSICALNVFYSILFQLLMENGISRMVFKSHFSDLLNRMSRNDQKLERFMEAKTRKHKKCDCVTLLDMVFIKKIYTPVYLCAYVCVFTVSFKFSTSHNTER